MIKTIYDKDNKYYKHKYYCDWCLEEIKYGEIFRCEIWIFERDLCATCKKKWDDNESSM